MIRYSKNDANHVGIHIVMKNVWAMSSERKIPSIIQLPCDSFSWHIM